VVATIGNQTFRIATDGQNGPRELDKIEDAIDRAIRSARSWVRLRRRSGPIGLIQGFEDTWQERKPDPEQRS
jgi:hypothetical protein